MSPIQVGRPFMKISILRHSIIFFLGALIFIPFHTSATDDGRLAMFYPAISPDGNSVAFGWVGDIWLADIETGNCRRITDHIANDYGPVWFPDGNQIAFGSNRDGNDDIYSVSISGGAPTRHTWYGTWDMPLDISPDGKTILFRSARRHYSIDLWEVDVDGGMPRPVTLDETNNRAASYSNDGSKITATRGSSSWTRRKYNGSGDTDITIMNRDGSEPGYFENSWDGFDYWSVFSPDDSEIYFVSDRDGMENVYKIPAGGGDVEKITGFTDRPVLFLTISDTGRLAFQQDFKLWIKDEGSRPRQIDLDCASEPKHSQEVRTDISGNISEFEVSPDAKFIALISRGELYVTEMHDGESAELGDRRFGEAVRITNTAGRERSVTWHPDGDRVAFISDTDGNQEVYEIDLRTFELTRLTRTPEEEYSPDYSPDGKEIAFYRGNSSLVIRDLESGDERVALDMLLVTSPWPPAYFWSPDSRWIAYTGDDALNMDDVFVVGVREDTVCEPVNVTLHHDSDYIHGWSDDGSSIYFLSSRDLAYGLNGWGSWSRGYALYVLPLKNEAPPRSDFLDFPPLEEDEDEEDEDVEEDLDTEVEETSDDEDELKIEIDFDRINERARLITPTRGGGYQASLSPDGKTFVYDGNPLGSRALWSVPFDGGNASHIADVGTLNGLQWHPDGKGVYYLNGGRVMYWNKNNGSVSTVQANGRLTIDLGQERLQMVGETGRMLTTGFYDPEMHGIDWDEAVEYYAPLVEETNVPEAMSLLMNMLFGELDGSHLSAYTTSSYEGVTYSPGFLGMEFDAFTEGSGLLVTKVYARGPADYSDTRVEVGEWVTEINDVPVSNDVNIWALLDDTTARSTKLIVASDQDGTDSREITIGPVNYSSTNTLLLSHYQTRYLDWVETKEEIVEEGSDGRVGYIHIPGMSGGPLEEFTRELFTENFDKDALILDVRFNGGGNTHEQLLDILSRPQFGWAMARESHMIAQPRHRWDRPIVLLINQNSFSDAEIFPSGFKALGLGTVIGVPTHGGVIGTWTLPLVDGITRIRVPRNGWYTIDGENMENLGIQPDIYVEQDLNHVREGVDDQLNYAIEYLLDRI